MTGDLYAQRIKNHPQDDSEGIEIKNPITDALKFLGKRFFYMLF